MTADAPAFRPADLGRGLLRALDASEGRRRRRLRDTRPDAVGLDMKRGLLERLVAEDPESPALEAWLLRWCAGHGLAQGPARAIAGEVLEEWRLAGASPSFRQWLAQGAPSDDAVPD